MIAVGEKDLTIADLYAILFENKPVILAESAMRKVENSHSFIGEFSKGKLIYGINTGFGPMAQYKIAPQDLQQLQYNLIRSHSSGTGKLLSPKNTKALMVARLCSLMKGYSGIHPELVILLRDLINKDILPCVFEHGGVGASGDLVQLAHLALCLIGEGEVLYKGEITPTAEVYAKEGIKALSIHQREGLAILNGTSSMTGIGIVNSILAQKLVNWSILFSSFINELVEAFDDHFSVELNAVKPHPGQQKVAEAMRSVINDSKLVRKRKDHLYESKNIAADVMQEKVQEYYSLRCVPQILGPIYDTIMAAEATLEHELNSVNDNPIIDVANQNVFHGGNFHGDYVALEMDKLKIAVTKLAMLSERQLNFLLNDKLNQVLTPFVNLGKLGLNFGSQGTQFTATSTTAECQTLSNPMYIHSIPNNNDNQDIVSMGTNAAIITRRVIDNAFQVLSIHAIALIQAVDYLKKKDRLSSQSRMYYDKLRAICPQFIEDRPLYKEIKAIASFMKRENINII